MARPRKTVAESEMQVEQSQQEISELNSYGESEIPRGTSTD
jgi:hypothetical protein